MRRRAIPATLGRFSPGSDDARPIPHGGVRQVDLLRRYRAGEQDELVAPGIQLTINAIATGIRNSG